MDIGPIICRYLVGETTEQETRMISDWIEESEGNRKLFCETKAVWNSGQAYRENDDLASFSKFMSGVNRRIETVSRKKRNRIIAAISATAGIAASILLAVFLTPSQTSVQMLEEPYFTYENTSGTARTITLEDGTEVWMKDGSTLSIQRKFSEKGRDVTLTGKAYFDVVKNDSAPFRVHTGNLTVRVLGTAFCVETDGSTGDTDVILERGSVSLQSSDGHNLATLTPDHKAEYDSDTKKLRISSVDAANIVLLEYNLVSMTDATLYQIISRIEDDFNVRLSGSFDGLDRKYTFSYLRTNTIDEVLKIMEYLTGDRYEVVYKAE